MCANMQIRPGSVSHTRGEKKIKCRESRERYVHGILRGKFEKSLSLRKTLAVSQRQRRVWEINWPRRAVEWQSSNKEGETENERKTSAEEGKWTYFSGWQLAESPPALVWLPVRYEERVWRERVRLCVGSDQPSAAAVCRLNPALLYLYWIGVGRADITAFIFSSPPFFSPLLLFPLISY